MSAIIFAWIKDHWKFVVGLTAIVITFGFGYFKGYQHEKAKYDAHLANDAALVAVAKAENQRRLEEQQAITTNVAKEYADAVSKINDYYKSHPRIVRVCNQSNDTNTLYATSQSSSGTNQTFNGTAEAFTEIDMQLAAKEIAQCQALIEFEKRQDEVR